MASSARRLAPLASLLLLTAAVHAPAVRFGFVGYDDPQRVLDNPLVRDGLTWRGLVWAWTTTAHAPYAHPLTWLSHMLDCEIFALDPSGHHATNLVLHLVSVALLYGFLARATSQRGPAFAATALFALHPVQAGTVAWISARPDLLATMFSLAAVWAYAVGRRRSSLLAFAGALLGKPVAAVLPMVLLIVDRWPLEDRRTLAARVRDKWPWWLLAATAAATVLLDRERVGGVDASLRVPLGSRVANAVVSCVRYLGFALWPVRLSAHEPHPYLPGGTPWATWQVAAAALLIAGITWAAWRAERMPALRTGWLWFLAAVLPVSGVVQVGDQGLALRYLYFSGIGLCIAAAWMLVAGVAALSKSRAPRWAVVSAAAVLLLALAWGSRQQAAYWRDSRTLFARAVELHPTDAAMHYNLAVELERAGETGEATAHYRRTIEIWPGHSRAHNNLGVLLSRAGDHQAALGQFREAVDAAPGFAAAWNNLGNALRKLGRAEEADAAHARSAALAGPPDQ